MKAALYCRVSTADQHATNQLEQLRAWCAAAGHEIVAEYVEHESGGKSAAKRAELSRMLADAHKRRFQIVVVWAIDRLSREGMVATVRYLETLAQCGVLFHSYSEPALCSDNEMVRDIVLAVMSALARAERQRISERTKAGMDRVRRAGVRIGRPALDSGMVDRVRAIRAEQPKLAANAIAKLCGIDPKSARKYLAAG